MCQFIAYCGLDCGNCEARLATDNHDDVLKEKIAKEWSELNKTQITKEMINCVGCRRDGVKTVFCNGLCEIRKCAIKKNFETCKDCSEKQNCEKLKLIIKNNEEAKERILL